MTHLYHDASLFGIGHLFKVGVSEINFLNHKLSGLGLDVVADIIWMLGEYKGASLSKFEENTTEGECETSKTSPNDTELRGELRLEELNWVLC